MTVFTLPQTCEILAGYAMVAEFRASGQLVPCIEQRKRVLFRVDDVKRCALLLASGKLPDPPLLKVAA